MRFKNCVLATTCLISSLWSITTSGEDLKNELYLLESSTGRPTIAMHPIRNSRKVTSQDLETVESAKIVWSSDQAAELKRLRRFKKLRAIHVWGGTEQIAVGLASLPTLKRLYWSHIKDEHVPALLGLSTLESLEGTAEQLSIQGFSSFRTLENLKDLRISGFWTPVDQIKFLRNIHEYTAQELEVVAAIHAIGTLSDEERDLASIKLQASLYIPIMLGTADDRARAPWRRDAKRFLNDVLSTPGSFVQQKQALATQTLKFALASKKDGFYDAAHRAVERYSGLQFKELNRPGLQKQQPLKQIDNTIGMRFNLIPAGKFAIVSTRGKESSVEVANPFLIGVYEVTQSQFQKVMGYNPSGLGPRGQNNRSELPLLGDSLPVNNITSFEAMSFCWKLSNLKSEKAAKRSYRLPTENEWELACRAGTTSSFHFGGRGDYSNKVANLSSIESANPLAISGRPVEVGSFSPNAFGLFDMHGNVCEPCLEPYADLYASAEKIPLRGALRGGSFASYFLKTGSHVRDRYHEYVGDLPLPQVGLRVVCVTGIASPLSEKILEYQRRKCDPNARRFHEASRRLKDLNKKIDDGLSGYLFDRAKVFTEMGRTGPEPDDHFERAKVDLVAYRKTIKEHYQRVRFAEAARDLGIAAGDRFSELGRPTDANAWWERAVRAGDYLAQSYEKQESQQQNSSKGYNAGFALLDVVKVLEKLGRSDEAIERLGREIVKTPTLMALFERRAELKIAQNDIDGAITDLRSALRANPNLFKRKYDQYKRSPRDYAFDYYADRMNQLADLLDSRGDKSLAAQQRAAISRLKDGKIEVIE